MSKTAKPGEEPPIYRRIEAAGEWLAGASNPVILGRRLASLANIRRTAADPNGIGDWRAILDYGEDIANFIYSNLLGNRLSPMLDQFEERPKPPRPPLTDEMRRER